VRESVYAVAMDARGTLVAAGSTESSIRVVDARSGEKVVQLKGHTDNVRCTHGCGGEGKEGAAFLGGQGGMGEPSWRGGLVGMGRHDASC
jgi:hypothetical protein